MHRLGFILCACLLAGCGVSHAGSTEADDTRAWQGTWNLVSCFANGEAEKGNVQWIVSGDHYNVRLNGQTGQDPYKFKLDPKNKQIDVFHHETPKGSWGGSLKGIYDIHGDTLKVCYDLKGQHFPRTFEAGRGSGQVIYQFQRVSRD